MCEKPECDASPTWFAGDWGKCDTQSQCGSGIMKRIVECRTPQGPVAEYLCEKETKPIHQVTFLDINFN